jgi:hypothetical protein
MRTPPRQLCSAMLTLDFLDRINVSALGACIGAVVD